MRSQVSLLLSGARAPPPLSLSAAGGDPGGLRPYIEYQFVSYTHAEYEC